MMEFEVSKSAAKEGGFAWAFSLIGAIVRYANNIILARVLGAYSFGLYAIANTIVTVTSIVSSLGFPTSIVHFVAKEKERGDYSSLLWFVDKTKKITFFVSVFIVIIFILFTPYLSQKIYNKEGLKLPLYGLILSLPFLALYNVRSSVLQGLRKIRKRVFIERIAHPLIFSILLLFAVFLKAKMEYVLISFFVSAVFVYILTEYWNKGELGILGCNDLSQQKSYKELFSFSIPILFLNFLSFFILQSDILVMGYFRDPKEVGIYAIASRLALGVGMPADSLGASLAPLYSAFTERKDKLGLSNLYKTSTRWIFIISSYVSIILIFGSTLILSLFGKDFRNGVLPLSILTLGQLFSASFGTNGTLITQTGHPKINMLNSIFIGTFNVLLLFFLVPKYGIIGASLSSAISLIILNIVRSIEIEFILKISPWNKTILKPLFSLIVTALFGFFIFSYSTVLSLILSLTLITSLLFILGFEKEDRDLIERALQKVKLKNG